MVCLLLDTNKNSSALPFLRRKDYFRFCVLIFEKQNYLTKKIICKAVVFLLTFSFDEKFSMFSDSIKIFLWKFSDYLAKPVQIFLEKSTLLYKVPSNSTCKNFATNV